jgi:type I restriction enzyme R subunit
LTKLTESAIEDLAIRLLEQLGYSHIHAPDIAADGKTPESR